MLQSQAISPRFHQPVAQEDALALQNIRTGEQFVSIRIDNTPWNRRFASVCPVSQYAQDEKANQEYNDRRLNPSTRDEQRSLSVDFDLAPPLPDTYSKTTETTCQHLVSLDTSSEPA
jgi:hypothetical protein